MPCVAVSVCPPVATQAERRPLVRARGKLRANTARHCQHWHEVPYGSAAFAAPAGRAPAASLITASCSALGATRYAVEPT